MQVCPNCGEENPDRFRLCGICGTTLAPEAPPEEVRKTVTIVLSDLEGSTSLGERLDTESLREVLNLYFSEMKAAIERHGGTLEKFIGDAVVAVFGLPTLHEDDALRAVRAAADMQGALAAVNEKLQLTHGVMLVARTGVNTGEIVAGDVAAGQHLVTGDPVNVAARLEQAAPPMEILIGEPTYRLVKDAVEVERMEPLALKGKAEPVPAYRLLAVTDGEGVARHLDAPMVGRRPDLARLTEALDRAIGDRTCQLVTVLGSAGVGKSRLLQEFVQVTDGRATSVSGRCLSYGEGITFWPLAEMTREAAGIAEDDQLEGARRKLEAFAGEDGREAAERVAAAIGLSDASFPVQETFWGARRLLEIMARREPLIALIEDIHWAEPTLLDLLRVVADTATDAPIVIACSARPELLEERPDWGEGHHTTISLEPLSDEESSQVVENLLGEAALDDESRGRIIEAAAGNPLFVEQMLSMLVDDGFLRADEDGRWVPVRAPGAFVIPPTIAALVNARLDRLGPSEQVVIERSAVIGQTFYRGAVRELAPDGVKEQVGPSLGSLTRKGLIRPHDSVFAGEEAFRFVHILIRDAAYQRLLKRHRAELHERLVDWFERAAPERVMEYEEIRGYHLEQAVLILAELAPLDEHGKRLGERGARSLATAGRRALSRGDMPAAANLLQRAAALLPEEDPARAGLLLDAGDALIELGEFSTADAVLEAVIEQSIARKDGGMETTARLVRLELHYTTEAESSEEKVVEEVQRAIALLEDLGDHKGLARAWRLLTNVHSTACRWGAAEGAARRRIDHARRAGDHLTEIRALPSIVQCALYGPTKVTDAIQKCEELLEKVRGDRRAEAVTMSALAHLEAMRGRFDPARDLYRRSRASLEELGWRLDAALTSMESGVVELLAGDAIAAEAELRRDYETLDRMGERNYISTTAAFLAEALYQQGRHDESERLTRFSEDVGAPDDVITQVLWRRVRGKILAQRGEFEEAEALVREAVDSIRRSDEPDSQANALSDLAEVMILAGRTAAALPLLEEASALFQSKGNEVSAGRTRELIEALASGGRVIRGRTSGS